MLYVFQVALLMTTIYVSSLSADQPPTPRVKAPVVDCQKAFDKHHENSKCRHPDNIQEQFLQLQAAFAIYGEHFIADDLNQAVTGNIYVVNSLQNSIPTKGLESSPSCPLPDLYSDDVNRRSVCVPSIYADCDPDRYPLLIAKSNCCEHLSMPTHCFKRDDDTSCRTISSYPVPVLRIKKCTNQVFEYVNDTETITAACGCAYIRR